MDYFIYDNSTGIIQALGYSLPAPVDRSDYSSKEDYENAVAAAKAALLVAVAGEGQTAIEGTANPKTQKWDTTNDELTSYTPADTTDYAAENRTYRDNLLRECDWTQLPDSPLTSAKKTEWQTYRQDLRDLPEDVDTFSTAFLTEDDLPTQP